MLNSIYRLFCKHKETVRRIEGNRLFTECVRCLHQSPGIEFAPAPLIQRKVIHTPCLER